MLQPEWMELSDEPDQPDLSKLSDSMSKLTMKADKSKSSFPVGNKRKRGDEKRQKIVEDFLRMSKQSLPREAMISFLNQLDEDQLYAVYMSKNKDGRFAALQTMQKRLAKADNELDFIFNLKNMKSPWFPVLLMRASKEVKTYFVALSLLYVEYSDRDRILSNPVFSESSQYLDEMKAAAGNLLFDYVNFMWHRDGTFDGLILARSLIIIFPAGMQDMTRVHQLLPLGYNRAVHEDKSNMQVSFRTGKTVDKILIEVDDEMKEKIFEAIDWHRSEGIAEMYYSDEDEMPEPDDETVFMLENGAIGIDTHSSELLERNAIVKFEPFTDDELMAIQKFNRVERVEDMTEFEEGFARLLKGEVDLDDYLYFS